MSIATIAHTTVYEMLVYQPLLHEGVNLSRDFSTANVSAIITNCTFRRQRRAPSAFFSLVGAGMELLSHNAIVSNCVFEENVGGRGSH